MVETRWELADWLEGDVDADGTRIHYHRTGGEGKPPIVLLHGITDNGLCWSRVARDLEEEYDVIMPDARGHGRSDRTRSGFSIDLLAEDVAAVIRALDRNRPYIFGHSMGAVTAMSVAADYPDLVRALILEDPPLYDEALGPAGRKPEDKEGQESSPAWPDFNAMSREERISAAFAMNPNWSEQENIPWADSRVEYDPAVLNHLAMFQEFPWREVLARIECPILLVTGGLAEQVRVTPAIAEVAAGLWKHGEVAKIRGAGHCVHRDRYEESMQAVRRFLSSH